MAFSLSSWGPPLERKSASILGVCFSKGAMKVRSSCMVVILTNSALIWNTRHKKTRQQITVRLRLTDNHEVCKLHFSFIRINFILFHCWGVLAPYVQLRGYEQTNIEYKGEDTNYDWPPICMMIWQKMFVVWHFVDIKCHWEWMENLSHTVCVWANLYHA